jgi:hypothetical protein
MRNALTISQARAKLGRLADQAAKGKRIFLKRNGHLLALGRVGPGIPRRPFGYFTFDDELTALANRAEPSFVPPDEN